MSQPVAANPRSSQAVGKPFLRADAAIATRAAAKRGDDISNKACDLLSSASNALPISVKFPAGSTFSVNPGHALLIPSPPIGSQAFRDPRARQRAKATE